MVKQLQIVLLALLFGAIPGVAEEIGALVLLPDGKPAVGAKVYARLIDRKNAPGWYSQREVTTETDALGYFAATTPKIYLVAADGRARRPYVLIDAPGCALYYACLTEVAKGVDASRPVIRLQPNFHFRGTVLGPDGKAAVGAKVQVVYWSMYIIEGSVLNSEDQIVTPQLITKTGKDGKFSLRGIVGPLSENADDKFPDFDSGHVQISATINGKSYNVMAHVSRTRWRTKPPEAPKEISVTLRSATPRPDAH